MILDDAAHANLLRRLRSLLLGVLVFGALGLGAELTRVEHWDGPVQWVPLGLLGVIAVASVGIWAHPLPVAVKLFRGLMVVTLLAGCFGGLLHFRTNAIQEREQDPTISGATLVDAALSGRAPTLAPGALIQLALLGLVAVYRHPGLERPT